MSAEIEITNIPLTIRHIIDGLSKDKLESEAFKDRKGDSWRSLSYREVGDQVHALGAALNFGYPLDIIDDYSRALLRYDFDNSRIYDVHATQGPLYDMKGKNVTSSATLTLKRDSRDKLWKAI